MLTVPPLRVLLVALAACTSPARDDRPPLPEEVGQPCDSGTPCAEGFVCTPERPWKGDGEAEGSCSVACETNEDCDFRVGCRGCDSRDDAHYCVFDGCK